MLSRQAFAGLLLACAVCTSVANAEGELHGFRKLLDVALMPADSGNYTYPNSTVFVALDDAWNKNEDGTGGCAPWWAPTPAGAVQCPKACAVKFNTSQPKQLSPLTVKVEKGSVSRLFVRPIRSAFLNVSSTVPPKANPDEFQSLATNEGLVYVQYSASGTTNTKFTASMGLVKKDPTANGQAVAAKVGKGEGMARHIPYCFFNVTWQIVPAGSIAGIVPASAPGARKAGAPAPAPIVATSAKKAAAPAPTAAAKKAAAPAPAPPAEDDDLVATKKPAASAPARSTANDDFEGY